MSQDSKGSFYDGTKINDLGSAQLLAKTEAEQGRNAALAQEQKLKVEYETGLTELQQKNVETIHGIQGKYPHALQEHVSQGGDVFYGFKKTEKTLEGVYKELGMSGKLVNVLLSKDGIAISDSKYTVFEFIEQAKESTDLQSIHSRFESNPNSGDESTFLDCKNDITTLPDSWKNLLSTNLKAFNAVNLGLKDVPQEKTSAIPSFLDSI